MTKAGREKEKIEGLLREVRAYLPPPDLYERVLTNTPSPESVWDNEGYRRCKEAEEVFRKQVTEIDPTALSSDSNFWSTLIEEFGAGM